MSDQRAEDRLTAMLGTEIGRLEPGHAPVEAAISAGRTIRARRRARWGGGLAAVAVLGIAAPFVVGGGGGSQDTASGPYGAVTVTVNAPGTDSHGLPVFSGSIGGKTWTAKVGSGGPNAGCVGDWLCPGDPAPADPVGMVFMGGTDRRRTVQQVVVLFRADVTGIEVTLADGDVLTVQPAVLQGEKVALFELPDGYLIDQVVAHTAAGDRLGIPFHTPDGGNILRQWYAPGAVPAPTTHQVLVATGRGPRDNGSKYGNVGPDEAWTATAEVGPFGVCIVEHWGSISTASCTPVEPHPSAQLGYLPIADPMTAQPYATEIDPSVDHVEVVYDDGSRTTLHPVLVDGHAFVGLITPVRRKALAAFSYDRAGHVIGDPAGQPGPMSKDYWYTADLGAAKTGAGKSGSGK
jgi:hypothetical protein